MLFALCLCVISRNDPLFHGIVLFLVLVAAGDCPADGLQLIM